MRTSNLEKKNGKYALRFSDVLWDEIEAMAFGNFEPSRKKPFMSRGEWLAIAEMSLGKAVRLERGDYDFEEEESPERETMDWAFDMRRIAAAILDEFKPGDGQI